MQHAAKSQPGFSGRAPAAEVSARPATAQAMADLRPQAAVQRALAQQVHASPTMVAQRRAFEGLQGAAVQRQPDEEMQLKRAEPIQRVEGLEEEMEEMPGQLKRAGSVSPVQRQADPGADGGLPSGLRSGVEALSGVSMDGVQVHYNSSAPAQLNALAYAQGRDIHLGPGQENHLPHEAWHVAQQAQGRVQATTQMKEGVPVNDDAGLEHEADVMGARAAAFAPAHDAGG